MNIFLRQKWNDPRLAFNFGNNSKYITLNYNQYNTMWVPDLFVKNEKDGTFHEISVPNRLIRVSFDGTILYSQR